MNKPTFDDFLNESLNTLDKDIAPQKDLWVGVERAIVNTNESVHNPTALWPKLTAMAACLVAGLVALNMYVRNPEPQPVIAMSNYFTQQKQSLLVQYKNQKALTDNWQAQLNDLENAENAIKQALENEPQNQTLLAMLAQIYQQQLDLINKVHAPYWQTI